jgi:hypothetical protein
LPLGHESMSDFKSISFRQTTGKRSFDFKVDIPSSCSFLDTSDQLGSSRSGDIVLIVGVLNEVSPRSVSTFVGSETSFRDRNPIV